MLRDLHGEMADAARGADDQHALAGGKSGLVGERLQRRSAGDGQRGGLIVVDAVGDRNDAFG